MVAAAAESFVVGLVAAAAAAADADFHADGVVAVQWWWWRRWRYGTATCVGTGAGTGLECDVAAVHVTMMAAVKTWSRTCFDLVHIGVT